MIKTVINNGIKNAGFEEASTLDGFTFYHTKQWCEVLRNTFGWEIKTIEAYQKDDLIFFLPFVNKFRFDFNKYNISLPLSHKVGPAYSSLARENLTNISEMIKKLGNFIIHDQTFFENLTCTSDYTLSVLGLSKFDKLDDLFNNFNKSSIQRKIFKAQKEGVAVKKEESFKSFINFSKLQSITRKKQGSPAYPEKFFTNLHNSFGNTSYINLFIAYYNNRPVSGVIFTNFGDTSIYSYGASVDNRDLLRLGINQIVMWEAVKDAYKHGIKTIDFGKTPINLTSLKEYKEKWGATSSPLYYSYTDLKKKHCVNREGIPVKLISRCLQKTPTPIFEKISPNLLKLVS